LHRLGVACLRGGLVVSDARAAQRDSEAREAALKRRFTDRRLAESLNQWSRAVAAMKRGRDAGLPLPEQQSLLDDCHAAQRRHEELLSVVSVICKCCAGKLPPGALNALCSRRCRRMYGAIDRGAR
jgi:hypothetical protein